MPPQLEYFMIMSTLTMSLAEGQKEWQQCICTLYYWAYSTWLQCRDEFIRTDIKLNSLTFDMTFCCYKESVVLLV